jgi:hypothetical protein
VMKKLQDYITYVQQIYSKLKHAKGGAILCAPNSPVQIDGQYGNFTPTIQLMFWNVHQMKGRYQYCGS